MLVPQEEATDADIFQAWREGVDVYDKKPLAKAQIAATMTLMTRSIRGESVTALILDA
jgi:hypothetical protein